MLFRRRFLISSAKTRLKTWLSALTNSSTNSGSTFSFLSLTKMFAKQNSKSEPNGNLTFTVLSKMFANSNSSSWLPNEKLHIFQSAKMKTFADQKTNEESDPLIAKAGYCHHKALQKSNIENNEMIPHKTVYGKYQESIHYTLKKPRALSGRANYCVYRADYITKTTVTSEVFRKPVYADCHAQDVYDLETIDFKSCNSSYGCSEGQNDTETYATQSCVFTTTFHASKLNIVLTCVAGLKSCPVNGMSLKENLGTVVSSRISAEWSDPVLKNNVLGITQSRNVTQTDNIIHIA